MINNITSQTGGSVYVPESDINNVSRIFSGRLSYNKGAMVVHMLRYKLGDTHFFQGMKNYLVDANLAFGYAESSDLKYHLETVSGQSLTEFFNDWVYGQGYPTYQFLVENLVNNQVKITVNQTQSHPSVSFFEMPLTITLLGAGGQQTEVVLNNTVNNQSFIENVPFTVTSVVFDNQRNIISKNNSVTLNTTQQELNPLMRLYPNPASNVLNLQLPAEVHLEKVIFYNTLGQVIKTSTETSWDVSSFANGVYYLKVFNTSGTKTFTFIKG